MLMQAIAFKQSYVLYIMIYHNLKHWFMIYITQIEYLIYIEDAYNITYYIPLRTSGVFGQHSVDAWSSIYCADRELTGDNHSEDSASEVTTEPAIGISHLTLSELVLTSASNQLSARPKASILNQLVAESRALPQVKTESALTRPKYWMPFAYSSLIDNCPMRRLYPT